MELPPLVVGISGRAGHGKDTVAAVLGRWGFKRFAFADALKDAARAIFSLSEEQLYGSLKEEVDERWGMSPRQIFQRLGTEACRREFGDDIWQRALAAKVTAALREGSEVAIADVRFPNEAAYVKSMAGIMLRVNRPGWPAVAAHVSETLLDDYAFDAVVENSDTKDDLADRVFEAMKPFRRGRK